MSSQTRILAAGFYRGSTAPIGSSFRCNAVVIGSGAGGGMAALRLAEAGLSVIVLEEGRNHSISDFSQREDEMLPELFAEMGGRRTDDLSLMILSGKGVGGSTVHNTNLCKPSDPQILDHWTRNLGISGISEAEMNPHFSEVMQLLNVQPVEASRVNANNDVFRRGTEALNYAGGLLSHNRQGCIGSGFCELGCAYNAKMNSARVLIPRAVELGAAIVSEARAHRILHDGAKAMGVEAQLLDSQGNPRGAVSIAADLVFVAASAIGSPALLQRSAVPDPERLVGKGLHLHPGAPIAAEFEESIEAWKGIPQSFECTEFLDLSPTSSKRVWLIPSFAHPVGTAVTSSGFGPSLMKQMRSYPHTAAVAAMVHDESEGEVYLSRRHRLGIAPNAGSGIRIRYQSNLADREQLALGARECARIYLRAGAKRVVIPGVPPMVITNEGELSQITTSRFLPHDVPLTAVHPMSSVRFGKTSKQGPTRPDGSLWSMRNVVMVDGSIFPTSLGTPPQLSIYTFASKISREAATQFKSR